VAYKDQDKKKANWLKHSANGYCPHERVEGCLESERKIRQGFKESGNLILLLVCIPLLVFLSGCVMLDCPVLETDPSRYQCRTDPDDPLAWGCTKDDVRFACRKTTCVPDWCDLPIQDCSLPPLTDGTDSCGFPCSKPSTQWTNCIEKGETNE